MGEFESGFSDMNHHHGHQGGSTNKQHSTDQLTSPSSGATTGSGGGWRRKKGAGVRGGRCTGQRSGHHVGGGEGLIKRHSYSLEDGPHTDEDETVDDEFINHEVDDEDDDDGEDEDEDEDEDDDTDHDGNHNHRHSNHHNNHHRYSYGKTFSTLYDRLWSLLRSAFKKEHKLDQMELFNEACAARLAANYSANKSRRRRELEILCKKTKFTRNELKLLYWGWKCACPNGILTESTFKEIYAQFFPQAGDSSLYAHYVYSAMFNDKVRTANGEVTFSDYASALSTLSRGSTSDKLEWIFKLYDINSDGALTCDEIVEISRAIYALLGYYVSPGHDSKTCEDHGYRVFQKLDIQSKGYITFDEFLQVCSKDETIISSMQLLDTIGLD
ncbi:Kv channel-interacting protein 4-like [Panonychus citri]|uniref:Kv channel-interacting protein 4-like n=1 Tax=Panonychus citri TaxID=50023 RepID=UPI002307FF86|nr:Kv channel-interacting protein 4-like [Panonychus citri]